MGVEPTLDQEAGRATVLKTAQSLFQGAPGQRQQAGFGFRTGSPLSQRDPACASVVRAFAADFAANQRGKASANYANTVEALTAPADTLLRKTCTPPPVGEHER